MRSQTEKMERKKNVISVIRPMEMRNDYEKKYMIRTRGSSRDAFK